MPLPLAGHVHAQGAGGSAGRPVLLPRESHDLRPVARLLCPTELLDLGAGAGGPARILAKALSRSGRTVPRFVLTDLHPRVGAWSAARDAHPEAIDFHATPVDATNVPDDLAAGRARTIINVFHHFPPELATAALRDAVWGAKGVFVAEGFARDPLQFANFLSCSAGVAATTGAEAAGSIELGRVSPSSARERLTPPPRTPASAARQCSRWDQGPALPVDGLESEEDEERAAKPTSQEHVEKRPTRREDWRSSGDSFGHHGRSPSRWFSRRRLPGTPTKKQGSGQSCAAKALIARRGRSTCSHLDGTRLR